MTQQVNELGVLGIASVPAVGMQSTYDISLPVAQQDDASIPAVEEPKAVPPITQVYVVSTDVVNGYDSDETVLIDMVLNVSVSCPDAYKTFKVLKRLSLDRSKLAAEAMNCETIRVEEKLDPQQQELKRLRTLLGH